MWSMKWPWGTRSTTGSSGDFKSPVGFDRDLQQPGRPINDLGEFFADSRVLAALAVVFCADELGTRKKLIVPRSRSDLGEIRSIRLSETAGVAELH